MFEFKTPLFIEGIKCSPITAVDDASIGAFSRTVKDNEKME